MFARVTTMQIQGGKLDDAAAVVAEKIAPALPSEPGFAGQWLLTDPAGGTAVSVNFWDTQQDATAFEQSPRYRELIGQVTPFLAGPPSGHGYQVAVQPQPSKKVEASTPTPG